MTNTNMVTQRMVQEVGRTAEPAFFAGWSLTVDDLVRRTIGSDWESGYYRLKALPARLIAAELNEERPWDAARKIRAIAAAPRHDVELSDVLEGVLVD